MKKLILILAAFAHLSAPAFAQKITVINSTTGVGKAVTMSGGATIATNGVVSLGSVSLTSGVTGILPEANGGTNSTTGARKIPQIFANDAARTAATPLVIGQMGLQTDTGTLYYGGDVVAGGWSNSLIAASALTGTTLASNVVTSSLTGVGALASGSATTGFTIALSNVTTTGTLSGDKIAGGTLGITGGGNLTGTATNLTAGNATKWTTGRTIALTGDVTYTSGSLDGSGNVTGASTLAASQPNVTTLSALATVGAAGAFTTNFPGTTSASSAITGTVKIGNGTAATNVGIGGGNIYAGGNVNVGGRLQAAGYIDISASGSDGIITFPNQTFIGLAGSGGAIRLGMNSGNGGWLGASVSVPASALDYLNLSAVAGGGKITAVSVNADSNVVIAPRGTGVVSTTNITASGAIINSALTASKPVFTDASKTLTSGTYSVPQIVGSGNVLAASATNASVATYTTPNDGTVHSYSVGGYVNITAISAGTLTVQISFTDENNAAQTLTYFAMGLTSSGLTTTGFTGFAPMYIRAKDNTAITFKTSFTGVSITYDVGGTIESLY